MSVSEWPGVVTSSTLPAVSTLQNVTVCTPPPTVNGPLYGLGLPPSIV